MKTIKLLKTWDSFCSIYYDSFGRTSEKASVKYTLNSDNTYTLKLIMPITGYTPKIHAFSGSSVEETIEEAAKSLKEKLLEKNNKIEEKVKNLKTSLSKMEELLMDGNL